MCLAPEHEAPLCIFHAREQHEGARISHIVFPPLPSLNESKTPTFKVNVISLVSGMGDVDKKEAVLLTPRVCLDDTVAKMKQLIQAVMPGEKFQLIFGPSELEDHRPLREYDLQGNGQDCVLFLRGVPFFTDTQSVSDVQNKLAVGQLKVDKDKGCVVWSARLEKHYHVFWDKLTTPKEPEWRGREQPTYALLATLLGAQKDHGIGPLEQDAEEEPAIEPSAALCLSAMEDGEWTGDVWQDHSMFQAHIRSSAGKIHIEYTNHCSELGGGTLKPLLVLEKGAQLVLRETITEGNAKLVDGATVFLTARGTGWVFHWLHPDGEGCVVGRLARRN